MKTQSTVDLYVCDEIRTYLNERAQELQRVNRRLYVNKLLCILSRLHWKQIHYPSDYERNGTKLRIWVNQKMYNEKPDAIKDTLAWVLSSPPKKVSNMVKTLVDWKVIELKNEYKITVSARTYKLAEAFSKYIPSLEPFTEKDGAFVGRELQRRKQSEDEHPIIKEILAIYQNHVSLSELGLNLFQEHYGFHPVINDIAEAHRNGCFEDNKEALLNACKAIKFAPRHQTLGRFFKREFYASVGPRNGRIDHPLARLPREFRKFILLDGKPMVETDIVNCQPALSVGLIKQQLRKMYGQNFMADDVERMERYCGEGQFYEVVAAEAGISIDTPAQREKFKKNHLFPEVYYCANNNWHTKTQVAFRTLFPNADQAIRAMKQGDHRQFSVDLQKMESDVVVHTVFKRLVEEGYTAIPLHDAVYTNDMKVKRYAEQLIREILLDKYGTKVSFKGETRSETIPVGTVAWKMAFSVPVVSLVPTSANVA